MIEKPQSNGGFDHVEVWVFDLDNTLYTGDLSRGEGTTHELTQASVIWIVNEKQKVAYEAEGLRTQLAVWPDDSHQLEL